MKKFSKDDYQYWLNADFYKLVMDSRFDKSEVDDTFIDEFTKNCIAFSEKYRHYPGKQSMKWAMKIIECRRVVLQKIMPEKLCKQMLAEFYYLQERFCDIYNYDDYWAALTEAMVSFGEKYIAYANGLSSQIALAYIEGKQEELTWMQHMTELCDKKYAG